jgi:hypothetical protein
MNRILAVRPGDDVSALRRAISEAFHAKGDTDGGNLVNAQLSDMTEEGGNLAVRRGVADELAHYARTDPEQVAQFRTGLVGEALVGGDAPPEEGSAAQRAGTAAQRAETAPEAPVAGGTSLRQVKPEPAPAAGIEETTADILQPGGQPIGRAGEGNKVRELPGGGGPLLKDSSSG